MILTLLLPLVVQGNEPLWAEVSRNRQATHYVDASRVTVTGDRKKVWHRVDFATPQPNGTVTALYSVEVDCGRRLIALLGAIERDRAFRLVGAENIARPYFRAIVPGTVGERIYDYFCEPASP